MKLSFGFGRLHNLLSSSSKLNSTNHFQVYVKQRSHAEHTHKFRNLANRSQCIRQGNVILRFSEKERIVRYFIRACKRNFPRGQNNIRSLHADTSDFVYLNSINGIILCNFCDPLDTIANPKMILRTFTRNLLKLDRRFAGNHNPVDYAICLDLECTCDHPMQIQPMEVIEIACLKLDLSDSDDKRSLVRNRAQRSPTFHSFVRPVVNPELTLFCQELTGITQQIVDDSQTIEKVMNKLINWMKNEDLIDENCEKKKEFAFASCGNFDLNLLSPIIRDCQFNNNLELPIYFKEWINVKKTFINHKKEWPKGLYHMMELLDEEPSGRLHSAKDDCLNLARVVECLHLQGCKFYVTSKL